jgi:hypothetical protein
MPSTSGVWWTSNAHQLRFQRLCIFRNSWQFWGSRLTELCHHQLADYLLCQVTLSSKCVESGEAGAEVCSQLKTEVEGKAVFRCGQTLEVIFLPLFSLLRTLMWWEVCREVNLFSPALSSPLIGSSFSFSPLSHILPRSGSGSKGRRSGELESPREKVSFEIEFDLNWILRWW